MRVLYGLLLLIAGVTAGWLLKWLKAKLKLVSAERLARKKIQEVRREAERLRDQTLQEGKNQLGSERETFDKEASERRAELSGFEQQINQRFQLLEER
ncbi:MAG TPA: Rnase Y domain-containing protein, partial [Spirochaetia bacterium]|nr:Rnase Y domain-containing protein [Spirochaetia bacterium]